ncbi:hypothetical protein X727_23180 [Mesorhizobium sp. L103C119B0]|uniref:hypothetical protein n=1 Tax=Mesorhizobium sp. L103C119B0 TaxID=1287085 RepID=UPI0003D04F2E|nr:hypothetical protein [Mesorhizobium sp. L103C119B0]ESZ68183.1 hypothetical protein X727_23180 [Mesorhizobium sp. L103C119B0]
MNAHTKAALDPLSAATEPSNDMIVMPFHHAYRNDFGMIPVRSDQRFMLVSSTSYDPEHYPPGSCIQ